MYYTTLEYQINGAGVRIIRSWEWFDAIIIRGGTIRGGLEKLKLVISLAKDPSFLHSFGNYVHCHFKFSKYDKMGGN